MTFPDTRNLTADQIVAFQPIVDSTWRIWKALAWIDHAKRTASISSIHYAAIELRLGIELLWWENLALALGGAFTQNQIKDFHKSTQLYKSITRFAPDYRKLVEFTRIIGTIDSEMPPIASWDFDGELKSLHSNLASFLHSNSDSLATIGSPPWLVQGYKLIEDGAAKIAKQMSNTGVIDVKSMPPEVAAAWEAFKAGNIDADSVRIRLNLARPALRSRRLR